MDKMTDLITEAADPLFNIHVKGGLKGHSTPHRDDCEHCEELRQFAYAVLAESNAEGLATSLCAEFGGCDEDKHEDCPVTAFTALEERIAQLGKEETPCKQ